MKKKLVGVECLNEYICQSSNKLYADGSIILSPGAKDELAKRGVTIVYGPRPDAAQGCPPGCTCPACMAAQACPHGCTCAECTATMDKDLERLFYAVAAMLKTEYGITDHEQLKKISCQVVKTLKANI